MSIYVGTANLIEGRVHGPTESDQVFIGPDAWITPGTAAEARALADAFTALAERMEAREVAAEVEHG
jgi:hypothetical protein